MSIATTLAPAFAMLGTLTLAPGAAQDAAIDGTVIDATGLVLPGVEARNQASGEVSTAFTDGTGRFVIGRLADLTNQLRPVVRLQWKTRS